MMKILKNLVVLALMFASSLFSGAGSSKYETMPLLRNALIGLRDSNNGLSCGASSFSGLGDGASSSSSASRCVFKQPGLRMRFGEGAPEIVAGARSSFFFGQPLTEAEMRSKISEEYKKGQAFWMALGLMDRDLDAALSESQKTKRDLERQIEQAARMSQNESGAESSLVVALRTILDAVLQGLLTLEEIRKVLESSIERVGCKQKNMEEALFEGGALLSDMSNLLGSYEQDRQAMELLLKEGKAKLKEMVTERKECVKDAKACVKEEEVRLRREAYEQQQAREREDERRKDEEWRSKSEESHAKTVAAAAAQEVATKQLAQRFEEAEIARKLEQEEHEQLRTREQQRHEVAEARENQEHGRGLLELGQGKARSDIVSEEEVDWEKINHERDITNKNREHQQTLAHEQLAHQQAIAREQITHQEEVQAYDRFLCEQTERGRRGDVMHNEFHAREVILNLHNEGQVDLEHARARMLERVEAAQRRAAADLQHVYDLTLQRLRHMREIESVEQRYRREIELLEQRYKMEIDTLKSRIAMLNQIIACKDQTIRDRDQTIRDRDQMINNLNQKSRDLEQSLREKEVIMVKERRDRDRDVETLERNCASLKEQIVSLDTYCSSLKESIIKAKDARKLNDIAVAVSTGTVVGAAYALATPAVAALVAPAVVAAAPFVAAGTAIVGAAYALSRFFF